VRCVERKRLRVSPRKDTGRFCWVPASRSRRFRRVTGQPIWHCPKAVVARTAAPPCAPLAYLAPDVALLIVMTILELACRVDMAAGSLLSGSGPPVRCLPGGHQVLDKGPPRRGQPQVFQGGTHGHSAAPDPAMKR